MCALTLSRSDHEGPEACTNFFGGGGGDGSSEDSDACAEEEEGSGKAEEEEIDQSAEQAPKLPSPFLLQADSKSKLPGPPLKSGGKPPAPDDCVSGPTSSVFVNPFQQAEQAKLGILEKHVRLTEAAPRKPASKQVCFKFRKGTCHLGTRCRFFHDRSNIALGGDRSGGGGSAVASSETEQQDSGAAFGRGDRTFQFSGHGGAGGGGRGGGADGRFYHPAARFSRGQPADPQAFDEDNYMNAAKGRKRFGVSDDLVPPKKALTGLQEFRKKERPWTTKK